MKEEGNEERLGIKREGKEIGSEVGWIRNKRKGQGERMVREGDRKE